MQHFNITKNKSLVLQPPKLHQKDLILSYLVGLLDGDGTMYRDKIGKIRLSLCGGKEICEWMKTQVQPLLSPTTRQQAKVSVAVRTLYRYTLSCGRANDFYNAIANLNIPKLQRKWQIFT